MTRKGNNKQFLFNSSIERNLTQAIGGLKFDELGCVRKLFEKSTGEIKAKNKLTRYVKATEGGWNTVEFFSQLLRRRKRIYKTKYKVLKKRKDKFPKKIFNYATLQTSSTFVPTINLILN